MIQPQPISTQLMFAMMGNQSKMPSQRQMDEFSKLSMGEKPVSPDEAMSPFGRNPMLDIYGGSAYSGFGYAGSGRKPTSIAQAVAGAPRYMGPQPSFADEERFGILGKKPQNTGSIPLPNGAPALSRAFSTPPFWMSNYQVPQFPKY